MVDPTLDDAELRERLVAVGMDKLYGFTRRQLFVLIGVHRALLEGDQAGALEQLREYFQALQAFTGRTVN